MPTYLSQPTPAPHPVLSLARDWGSHKVPSPKRPIYVVGFPLHGRLLNLESGAWSSDEAEVRQRRPNRRQGVVVHSPPPPPPRGPSASRTSERPVTAANGRPRVATDRALKHRDKITTRAVKGSGVAQRAC